MIISHGRRYIFIHAPKTGGTSLALALEARAMKDDIMLGDTPKALKRRRRLRKVTASGRLWKHSTLADLYGLVTQDQIDAYFVFTLVRNPWDRMVSYYHWLREQSFSHPAVALAQRLEFSGFLHHSGTRAALAEFPFGRYVTDATGAEKCNLFIRLEHLWADIAPLAQHLGFTPGPIERLNRSDRGADYRAYYADRDAEIVAALCKEDIERFNYRFDIPGQMPESSYESP